MLRTRARLLTAILLIASAAAFTTGVIIERTAPAESHAESSHSAVTGEQPTISPSGTGERDSGEPGNPAPPYAAAKPAEHSEPAAHGENTGRASHEAHAETLLGINPEATPLIMIAILLSLVLAAAVTAVRSPRLLPGIALIMLAFAALDIRELTHQIHESRPGLAALAAAVALLHLLAAATALQARRTTRNHRRTRSQATAR
jgi:hypothetical protein